MAIGFSGVLTVWHIAIHFFKFTIGKKRLSNLTVNHLFYFSVFAKCWATLDWLGTEVSRLSMAVFCLRSHAKQHWQYDGAAENESAFPK